MKKAQFVFTMSNLLIVMFVSLFMKGNKIASLLVLLAWAVYNYQNDILLVRSNKIKRSKYYIVSNLIFFLCLILLFYHPNNFFKLLTYLAFLAYNISLWLMAMKYKNKNDRGLE